MNTRVQKKLKNTTFDALRKVKPLDDLYLELGVGLIDFVSVLNSKDWNFEEDYPSFHSLGISMCNFSRTGQISKYQSYCISKLSSVLYDARLLYENNLIDFTQLRDIAARVKNDVYKRFKSIEKSQAKKELNKQKLDKDSLVLLQAKLAILENGN